jgi:hypothetical protein
MIVTETLPHINGFNAYTVRINQRKPEQRLRDWRPGDFVIVSPGHGIWDKEALNVQRLDLVNKRRIDCDSVRF